ncbi:MAG: ABC transporter substrate-binding protein [Bacillota bacterium]
MSRKLGLLALALTLVLSLVGTTLAGCAPKPAPKTLVRVGIQPGVFVTPYFIAKDQGFFDSNVIEIKEASFLSGGAMNEGMLSGNIDLGYLGATPAIVAASRDPRVAIIAICDLSDGGEGILVQKDSKINVPADLKGKKIAVAKGSTVHRFLYEVLKNAGLDPNKDVSIYDMSVEDQVTALQTKNVDAVANWEPWMTKAEAAGGRRLIDDSKAVVRTYDVLYVNTDFAKQHPEAVKAFLAGHMKGAEFKNTKTDEAAKIVAKVLPLTPDEILTTFKLFIHPDLKAQLTPEFFGAPKEKARADIGYDVDFLFKQRLIKSQPDLAKLVDTSYLLGLSK